MRASRLLIVGGVGLALTGCVAAVPAGPPTYTVIPGQNKTEADLRADDASCRRPIPASTGTTTSASQATPVTEEQYYGCMASRGEAVIQQQVTTYPVYSGAPYVYPAYGGYPYGYGYGYPYGGYPYAGYPYGGYFGPYVGFGVGFGYGRFYGGGYRGGYYGGRGFGRGYGGAYHGGFHR